MAYTDAFTINFVPGSTKANLIDDKILAILRMLQERLEDKFVEDMTADPLVLLPEVSGLVTGKQLLIPWTEFHYTSAGTNLLLSEGYATPSKDTSALIAALVLPPGTTLKQVEFATLGISAGLRVQCFKYEFATGTRTSIFDEAKAENLTHHIDTVTGLSEVIDGDYLYYLSVDSGAASSTDASAFRLYGARVTYDTTSHMLTY